jgi:immunity protein 53 of polymorphic toxin system
MTPIEFLQQWYAAHCDGGWEHQHGIKIGTLDNPGWRVTIDLTDTELQDVPLIPIEHQMEDRSVWWRCWRDERAFHATCGVTCLQPVLAVFNEWARDHKGGAR